MSPTVSDAFIYIIFRRVFHSLIPVQHSTALHRQSNVFSQFDMQFENSQDFCSETMIMIIKISFKYELGQFNNEKGRI